MIVLSILFNVIKNTYALFGIRTTLLFSSLFPLSFDKNVFNIVLPTWGKVRFVFFLHKYYSLKSIIFNKNQKFVPSGIVGKKLVEAIAINLPYCLVRTGIGGVVAPSPRCDRAANQK